MNGVLKIELKNNLQYKKGNFTKKLQKIKEISQLSCSDKWINVSIPGLNAPNVAEEIWNRFNIHKNVKNNDLNNQIELLKHQQEILDNQIELERLKERNNSQKNGIKK